MRRKGDLKFVACSNDVSRVIVIKIKAVSSRPRIWLEVRRRIELLKCKKGTLRILLILELLNDMIMEVAPTPSLDDDIRPRHQDGGSATKPQPDVEQY